MKLTVYRRKRVTEDAAERIQWDNKVNSCHDATSQNFRTQKFI